MMLLAIAVIISCLSLPALALSQQSDLIANTSGFETDGAPEVSRAPEYIRIKNTSGYNCYTTYGQTAAEGAPVACMVSTGDYLIFIDLKTDGNGRMWVRGQIQGSHHCSGWYVWMLYNTTYMTIGY